MKELDPYPDPGFAQARATEKYADAVVALALAVTELAKSINNYTALQEWIRGKREE